MSLAREEKHKADEARQQQDTEIARQWEAEALSQSEFAVLQGKENVLVICIGHKVSRARPW